MKIDVEQAIHRALAKFNLSGTRSVTTPCEHGCLTEGDINTEFPIRSLVGVLLYVATVCRPDIMYAVTRVARMVTKPHAACISAAKRVLAYLKGTAKVGLEYSHKNELRFRLLYAIFAKKGHESLPPTVAFCDADLGGGG